MREEAQTRRLGPDRLGKAFLRVPFLLGINGGIAPSIGR
jgi:hypothetical protein